MICGSADCEAPAFVTALWLGQELAVCMSCANRAYGIAAVMGFTLHFAPLAVAAEPLAKEVEEWLAGENRTPEEAFEDLHRSPLHGTTTHYDPEDGAISTSARRRT